jgi:hypothetical protein
MINLKVELLYAYNGIPLLVLQKQRSVNILNIKLHNTHAYRLLL